MLVALGLEPSPFLRFGNIHWISFIKIITSDLTSADRLSTSHRTQDAPTSFPSTSSIHIGPKTQSVPICPEGEELFRLQLRSGTSEDDHRSLGLWASYRIFTESQSNTHAECLQCESDYPGINVELSLPTNQCHTAIVGRDVVRYISCINGGVEELVMTWGNETIKRNNAYLFERVDFGDGCEAKCDEESESEFEFFLDRRVVPFVDEKFTWDLREADTGMTVHQGGIEAPYNQSAFVYERVCVPKSSCFEFDMGYPANMLKTNETFFYDNNMFSTRLDGAVYADSDLEMGLSLSGGDNKLREVITLGDACNAEAVCNSNETLIELEFKVNDEVECISNSENNFTSSSAVSTVDFGFWIKDQDAEIFSSDDYYTWSGSYEGFETGKTYSSITCVPSNKCAKLYVLEGIPATYKVYQDGIEMTQRVAHTDEDSPDKGTVTTDLGEVSLCSSGLILSLSYYGLFAAVAGALALLM